MMHCGIKRVPNRRHDSNGEDHDQEDEPGGSPAQGLRRLGDAEGIDKSGCEQFE